MHVNLEEFKRTAGIALTEHQRERFRIAREWLREHFGEEGEREAKRIESVSAARPRPRPRPSVATIATTSARAAAATIARPQHRASWTWQEDDELVDMVHREGYRNDDWDGKASRFSTNRSGNALSHRWYILRGQGLDGVGSARKASKAMPKPKKKHKYK